MTAHAIGGDREKCLAAGMDDYLAKPVLKQALREALQRFERHVAPVAGAPVNLDTLWDAASGDAVFARDLADQYLVQTAEQLGLLRAAVDGRSAAELQSVAHACKGSSDTCGAATLSSLLEQVEGLGHEGQFEQAGRLIADVEREFARVRAALEELPSRQASPGVQP